MQFDRVPVHTGNRKNILVTAECVCLMLKRLRAQKSFKTQPFVFHSEMIIMMGLH